MQKTGDEHVLYAVQEHPMLAEDFLVHIYLSEIACSVIRRLSVYLLLGNSAYKQDALHFELLAWFNSFYQACLGVLYSLEKPSGQSFYHCLIVG